MKGYYPRCKPSEVAVNVDEGQEKSIMQETVGRELAMLKNPIKINLHDFHAVQQVCCDYLERCVELNIMPSMSALALALGRSRANMYAWMQSNPDAPATDYIHMCGDCMAETLANAALRGESHPIVSIFTLKNWYGWRDTVELQSAPVVNNDMQPSIESIKEKYR